MRFPAIIGHLVLIISYVPFNKICLKKGIRTVANLGPLGPRHKGFGLAKTSVASSQGDPSVCIHYGWIDALLDT